MRRRARRPDRRGLGRARCRTAATSTSSLARRGSRRRPRRRCMLAHSPRRATRPCSCCVGADPSRVRAVWPPTLMMNKATLASEQLTRRSPGVRRSSGSRQGVLDAVADGVSTRGDRRPAACSSPSGSIPAADDETAVRSSRTARRCARRSACASRVAIPPRRPRARRAPRRARRTRSTAATDARSRRSRRGAIAFPLDPPFRAAWDPVPREPSGGDARRRPHRRGRRPGYASGDAPPGPRAARAAPRRRSTRCRTEVVREICETVDFHGGRPWTVEVAVWDLVGRALGEPLWRLLGGRSERMLAYASSGELVDARRARAALPSRCATRGVRAVKIRFHHADWRDDVARRRGGARRGRDGDGDHGRREPGLAHARRPRAALGRRDGGRSSRASSSGSASTGSRSRCGPTTSRATPRSAGARRRCASPPARWCAPRTRRATSSLRGGVDVLQPDVVLAGGHRRLPAHRRARRPRAAGRGRRTRGRTATACSRTCTPRSRSRPARTSRCRSIRRPGRPSGATGCFPRRSRSPPTGRSRRPAGPGPRRRRPTSTRSSSGGSADAHPRRRAPRAGRRSASRRSSSTARSAGEVLVRVAAAGVCHSDVHLADGRARRGALADGARARGRRRRRGGRRRRRRTSRRRPRRASASSPPAGECRRVPRGPPQPLRAAGERDRSAGHADGRDLAAALAGRHAAPARPR